MRLTDSSYSPATLASSVTCHGKGLHSGQSVTMTIHPAEAGSGIHFVRTDCPPPVSVVDGHCSAILRTDLCTVLGNTHGITVSTVEHLMAAFAARSVTDAVVELDGPEIPVCDGSASPFIRLLDEAGTEEQESPAQMIRILEPFRVQKGEAWMALEPADHFSIRFVFDFRLRALPLPAQVFSMAGSYPELMQAVSDARTVGFLDDYESLKARGLALGGSLDNAVVYDQGTVINPEGLRYPDECVRHKVLDALGDLWLLGAPLCGALTAHGSGHTTSAMLMHHMIRNPHLWRLEEEPMPRNLPSSRPFWPPYPAPHTLGQPSVFCL
jgi:UDP-3-O-[3-hydroxymyristoyl] N-acetylglucosamine deacetylase